MLWTTLVVLLILWLLALLLGAGRWILVFPVVMAFLLAYRLFVPRRRRW
ncbi:MAG: lmo0937 family membrane protein [Gemmatimonadota bacterium]